MRTLLAHEVRNENCLENERLSKKLSNISRNIPIMLWALGCSVIIAAELQHQCITVSFRKYISFE